MTCLDNLCLLFDLHRHALVLRRDIQQSICMEYERFLGRDIHRKNLRGMGDSALYSLLYYRVRLMRPKIVFVDRPFVGCDMAIRNHIQSLLQMLREEGITIVLFETSAKDVVALADHVLYL